MYDDGLKTQEKKAFEPLIEQRGEKAFCNVECHVKTALATQSTEIKTLKGKMA